MKAGKIVTTAIGAAFLFSGTAFAGGHKDTNKATLHLYETVNVDGKQLAPGDYTIRAENTGSQTTLEIVEDNHTIVSVPARAKPSDITEHQAYMTMPGPTGTRELAAVYMHGTEYRFLDADQGATQSSGN